ncbi:YidC/Oxa1 family membrane protein insertase [Thiohalospira halophila DSM 15071]|uniref:Membrane protein insertase YidC n=1 Tax=Thiohalospira halophila DSM 15071 TaxID=1123397 RepID=A0A1I1RQ40_9GAMM|nr:membrane protein insertase YidC [Thiohalospira halophila]SFD32660.1 YidC/Oxa1 family membrane protein insertase [Thiohalospira halophila DSM 15071]
MDLQKTLLWVALALVLVLLWVEWQEFRYGDEAVATESRTNGGEERARGEAGSSGNDEVPSALADDGGGDALPEGDDAPATPADSGDRPIVVRTDLLEVAIDPRGGAIRRADLLAHTVTRESDEPVRLLDTSRSRYFVLQDGLINARGVEGEVPNHRSDFEAERKDYALEEGEDTVRVPLRWERPDGLAVTKTYTFHRDSYQVDVDVEVANRAEEAWRGQLYSQIQRSRDTRDSFFLYTYTGGVLSGYNEAADERQPYRKIDFDDMADQALRQPMQGGWAAMIEHYFLAAILAPEEAELTAYTRSLDSGRFLLGYTFPVRSIGSGETAGYEYRYFIGPKEQERLEEAAPELDLTVDYGFLTILARPLYWLLDLFHGLTGNWGWSIILLTLLIKLAFFHLSAKSYRSMAHMRRVAPRLKEIKEKYADDRQRMNQAMMDLYKTEKINPLGGCLPILVQIPVFIALYWVLLESVELRHAPWIGWIQDLTSPDPWFILPIIMGASMLLQFKLNPAPMDPVQEKVMMIMPFVLTIFFAFFPAGLVLYWTTNNVLSIAQQWWITRRIESGAEK